MDSNPAAFVGNIPEFYDRGLGPMLFVDYAADTARRVAAFEPSRVLETAAGTGIVTRKLRDALPATPHLTATDLNQPLLEVARTKFRPGEQVELKAADAMALPFADGSFDAVACQFGLMFYPDKDKSYREVHRVLTPGGHYVVSVWDSHAYNPYARIAHELVGRLFPDNPPQFYKVPFSCHQIDPIKESLIAAGFVGIEIAVMPLEKKLPDAEAFARGFVFGNPAFDEIRSRGGVTPEEYLDELTRAYRGAFGAGSMPLQAIVFTATKPA